MKQTGSPIHEHPFYAGMVEGSLSFVAHRGGNGGPENTAAAFEAAQAHGAQFIETDIATTSDGVPVHFHAGRQAGRIIGATTFAEINTRRTHDRLGFTGGSIPSLRESLAEFPDMRFFLDLKSSKAPRPVAQEIKRAEAHDRVSIDGEYWNRALAVVSEIPDGLSTTLGPLGLTALAMGAKGLPGYKFLKERCLTRATSLSLPLNWVKQPWLEIAHDLGMPVFLYRVNTVAQVSTAAEYGATGIMTDKLALLGHAAITPPQSQPTTLSRAA